MGRKRSETCKHGHSMKGDNLYVYVDKEGNEVHHCRECRRASALALRASCLAGDRKERPTRSALQRKMKSQASIVSIARFYGVSDNTIRIWCQQLGIDWRR